MTKIIIHKSFVGHLKIDGIIIDDKIKELEIEEGLYDLVGGLDYYNTAPGMGRGKDSIIWGLHTKLNISENFVYHVYVKRKFSLFLCIPVIKVKCIDR